MSTHFTHSLAVLVTAAVLLVAGWFGVRHLLDIQAGSVPYALGKNDKEIISYNSASHILTQTTATGTTKTYVRNPEIVVGKNGSVSVKKHSFGLEHDPYIGIGGSYDGLSFDRNAYLGLNLVNAWRFDLGPALALSSTRVRPVLMLGYNVWSNTSVSFGYGVAHDIHLALTVRL